MANFWKVNQTTNNGAIRYWDLIETMLAAGWTQVEAGSNHADFDVKYPASIGGVPGMTTWEHLDIADAWVRMQDPAGGREFIINRKTANSQWTLVYSKAAKFIGGSPSATVIPTATDEYTVALNTYIHTTTGQTHHCWVSDVSPYPFYLVSHTSGSSILRHITMLEELGSSGGDTDPVTIIRGTGGSINAMAASAPGTNTSTDIQASGWSNISSVPFNVYQYCGANTLNFTGFLSTGVPPGFDGKDVFAPCLVLRRSADSDPVTKGITKNFLAAGSLRSSGDTFDGRTRIYIATANGAFSLPWNGDIPLV